MLKLSIKPDNIIGAGKWDMKTSKDYAVKLDAELIKKDKADMNLIFEKKNNGVGSMENIKGGSYKVEIGGGFVATFVDSDGDGKVSDKDKLKSVVIDGKEVIEIGTMSSDIKTTYMAKIKYQSAENMKEKYQNELDSLSADNIKTPSVYYQGQTATWKLGNGLNAEVIQDGNKIKILKVSRNNNNVQLANYGHKGLEFEAKTMDKAKELIVDHVKGLLNSKIANCEKEMSEAQNQFSKLFHYDENES